MPEIVYGADVQMLGCTAMVPAVSDTRLVLTNPLRKTLVTVGVAGSAPNVASAQILVQCESEVLDASPYCAASDDDYVYALAEDVLYRVANSSGLDTAGYEVDSFDVACADPRWVSVHRGYVYVPYEGGGLSVYSSDGELVARYDHILGETSFGVVDSGRGYFYAVDGQAARAVAATINTDGTLSWHTVFDLTGCKNVVGVVPDTSFFLVVCRDRVVLFDVVDRTAPGFLSRTRFSEVIHDVVRVGAGQWWFATEEYLSSQEDRFDYRNFRAVYLVSNGLFVLSTKSGRIIGQGDFTTFRPEDFGGESDETSYILQEDLSGILTEDLRALIQES